MARHRLSCIVVASLLLAPVARAQDRDAVFVHGLGSDAGTWADASGRLARTLAIRPHAASLNSTALYEAQAVELQQKVGGSVGAGAVAIGHSNGGLVARQWARSHALSSLITMGSPNQGAPLVDHLFEVFAFLDDILVRITNVSLTFTNRVSQDTWWWVPAQWALHHAVGVQARATAGFGLVALGFDARLPVMSEMRVNSSFMANMNSAENRARDIAAVPARAAIVNVAVDFDHGGPFRVVDRDNYEAWHEAINVAGISLEGLAGLVRILADGRDLGAFDLADEISGVAEWFLQFEEVWCRAVSDPSPLPIARCYEHDGLVPTWSQAYDYPRVPVIFRDNGPVHTRETAESDEQLYQALTRIAGVALRTADSGTPSEPQPLSPGAPPPSPPPADPPSASAPPAAIPPVIPPPQTPPPPTGRYKLSGGGCVWDALDSGPDQCSPLPPPGRYKFDAWGTCYWEPNDFPPDQCSPPPAATGRYKVGGAGCYWDASDSGPNQCTP